MEAAKWLKYTYGKTYKTADGAQHLNSYNGLSDFTEIW